MSTRSSPLLGYNNNVRHKGRVFHIQTEDSGAKYGHIMTHLFADGGRILKSVKTSYAEYIGNERMAEIVREMMKQQHKAMFIALRDGKFDTAPEAPSASAPPCPPPASADAEKAATAVAPAHRVAIPPPLPPAARGGADAPSPDEILNPGAPARAAPSDRESTEELPIDVAALERAASTDGAIPAPQGSSDLPPPPAERLRDKTAASSGAPPASRRGAATATVERRYAPTRPASIFGQARPQHGKSIFGEDLMGDRSLDEVILSYLDDDPDDGGAER